MSEISCSRLVLDEIIEDLPVGSLISPRNITTEYILQYVRAQSNSYGSNVEALYRLMDNQVEALEFHVIVAFGSPSLKKWQRSLSRSMILTCTPELCLWSSIRSGLLQAKSQGWFRCRKLWKSAPGNHDIPDFMKCWQLADFVKFRYFFARQKSIRSGLLQAKSQGWFRCRKLWKSTRSPKEELICCVLQFPVTAISRSDFSIPASFWVRKLVPFPTMPCTSRLESAGGITGTNMCVCKRACNTTYYVRLVQSTPFGTQFSKKPSRVGGVHVIYQSE